MVIGGTEGGGGGATSPRGPRGKRGKRGGKQQAMTGDQRRAAATARAAGGPAAAE